MDVNNDSRLLVGYRSYDKDFDFYVLKDVCPNRSEHLFMRTYQG